MKVLLTGFGPFLVYTTNPSGDIAAKLNGQKIGGASVAGKVLSVKHKESAQILEKYIKEEKPDAIIATGIANKRGSIALERVALNAYYVTNVEKETDEVLYSNDKEAYFSTLPLKAIRSALVKRNIPAEYSFWPDTFVSNEIFYEVMRLAKKYGIKKAGFIHIPVSHEQVAGAQKMHYEIKLTTPSMSNETLEEAIRCAIETTAKQ